MTGWRMRDAGVPGRRRVAGCPVGGRSVGGGRTGLLAMLLLVAGCSLFVTPEPEIPPDQDTPEHRACRTEARTSPEIRALARETFPQNTFNTTRMSREERTAFTTAYRRCLRAKGLAMPGGVEPVIRR
jgi:hypothetical protein